MPTLIRHRRIASPPSPDAGSVLRLEPDDDLEKARGLLGKVDRVEVNFPGFADGRGFSIARLLRERYGYKGELRAVGHVVRDHLQAMEACGFDAFLLKDGEDPEEALAAFEVFSEAYQASVLRPVPLFRRRTSMDKNLSDTLATIAADFEPAVLASSLSAEDMVITDVIARAGLPIGIFVLDTGRLHGDTLALLQRIHNHYGLEVAVYAPDAAAVAEYVRAYGRDAFYQGLELRKRCCHIRKVEPLARALAGKRAWITGQRREHAIGRAHLPEHELDAEHRMDKFNPLAAWSEAQVWQYIRERRVPYNRLYDQGYRSIGCAPCTRPILPVEDLRAGRWWWEAPEHKECGLHVAPDGRSMKKKEKLEA